MKHEKQGPESLAEILPNPDRYPLLIKYHDMKQAEIVDCFNEIDIRRTFSVLQRNFKPCKERDGK